MLYILALAFGTAVGLLLKGRLINITEVKFEKMWMILGAFALQAVYRIAGTIGFDAAGNYAQVVYVLSYAVLLLAFWYNRYFIGIALIGMGTFLNALVIAANGGKMPVSRSILENAQMAEALNVLQSGLDNKHILADAGTRLTFLSDIIPLPRYLNLLMYVVSIGDLFVVAGLFALALQAVKGYRLESGFFKKKTGNNKAI